jgi:hypothetical protein
LKELNHQMAVPTVIFENNDKAAHAVSRYIDDVRPSPQRFTLRPFQRHSPSFSPWWFVPSTEWPAYHCSKLFIHRFLPASEYLYTGFYVEHGLGKDLPDVKPSLVMQSNWYWFEFLHQAKNGALDPAQRQVLERSGCPVFVWLDAYAFNRVPTPEEVAQTPDDLIEFVIRSADLQFELTEQGNEILSLLSECASLHELAQHLERSQQDFRWYWLDLYFGIRLRYGTASTGTWGASEIWHNALEPWTPWVRAGSIGRSDW